MLHYIYRRLRSWPGLIFSGALAVGMFLLMWHTSTPRVFRYILDYQLAFTSARALKVIALWGIDGVSAYLNNIWVDFIFPVGYTLLLSGLVARAAGQPSRKALFFFSLPFLALACDYLENSLHIVMLRRGFLPDHDLLLIASWAAAVKWGIVALSVAVILVFAFRRLWLKTFPKERVS